MSDGKAFWKKFLSRKFLSMFQFLVMTHVAFFATEKIPWWGWAAVNVLVVFGYSKTLHAIEKLRKPVTGVLVFVLISAMSFGAVAMKVNGGKGVRGIVYPANFDGDELPDFLLIAKTLDSVDIRMITGKAGIVHTKVIKTRDPASYVPATVADWNSDGKDEVIGVHMSDSKARLYTYDRGNVGDTEKIETIDDSYRYKSILPVLYSGKVYAFYQSGHQAEHLQTVALYRIRKSGKIIKKWSRSFRGIASGHGFFNVGDVILSGAYKYNRKGFQGFAMNPPYHHVDHIDSVGNFVAYFVEGAPGGAHLFYAGEKKWSRVKDCQVGHTHYGWLSDVVGDSKPEVFAIRKGKRGLECPKLYDFSGRTILQSDFSRGVVEWDGKAPYEVIFNNRIVKGLKHIISKDIILPGFNRNLDIDGDGFGEVITVSAHRGKLTIIVNNMKGHVGKVVNIPANEKRSGH